MLFRSSLGDWGSRVQIPPLRPTKSGTYRIFKASLFPAKSPWVTRGEQRRNRPKTLSVMPESGQEAEWRAEFERDGELLVYDNYKQGAIYNDEAKRQAALRWLGEVSRDRRRREKLTLKVACWTFLAALGAIGVGLLGIAATFIVAKLFH